MELHSVERGGWVFIVTPISAVLKPYKVISDIRRPKNCGWYKLAMWYRLYSTSRPGASRESVIVGNRGLVIEGHHSLTTHFAVLHTIFATYNTTTPHFPATLA